MSPFKPFRSCDDATGTVRLVASAPIAIMLAFSSAIAQVPPGPADERLAAEHATEPGAPTPGAWRATQLLGQTLTSSLNESVGTVKDIVVDADGNVAAILVGIGGFLGLGERTVPIALRHVVVTSADRDTVTVSTSLSRDAIEQAAAMDPREGPLPNDQKP